MGAMKIMTWIILTTFFLIKWDVQAVEKIGPGPLLHEQQFLNASGQGREDLILQRLLASPLFLPNDPACNRWQKIILRTIHHKLELHVASDYLKIPLMTSRASYAKFQNVIYVPLNFNSLKKLMKVKRWSLPTRKLVNLIYEASYAMPVYTIPPSDFMVSSAVWLDHQQMLEADLGEVRWPCQEMMIAGHKKDYVLTPRLENRPGREAIYGFFRSNGTTIQPLSLFHDHNWIDYSQAIRFIDRRVVLNGVSMDLWDLYAHPELSSLVSDEGPLCVSKIFN